MRAYVIKRSDEKYLYTFFIYEDENFAFGELNQAKLFDSRILANNFFKLNYSTLNEMNCKVVPIEIRKIPEPIKLLPCICGCNRRNLWLVPDNSYLYECKKCYLKTRTAKTKTELKEIWNDMIKEKMKDNK